MGEGDLLFSYLFILLRKAFSWTLSGAREEGFILGFKEGGRGKEGLKYPLFAC